MGSIITSDYIKHKGFIKLDTCEGSHVYFKPTKSDTEKRFSFAEVKAVVTENDSFIIIKKMGVKDIALRYYNYKNDIIVRVIEDGALCLYKHCVVDYQNSMFNSEKYILYSYILCKKGENIFYSVPLEPPEFLKIAEIFFSDYTELITEINTTDYMQEIVHKNNGKKSLYPSVTADQIRSYVQKYNQWLGNFRSCF